ncbi:MAG: autotransporter-associated beta strand repeat-containing protein [Verrucomicrobia bacterium]|nr:autotransporter-associated beta strand repeat-containing protein [Verrucomicrobiota bacterium]
MKPTALLRTCLALGSLLCAAPAFAQQYYYVDRGTDNGPLLAGEGTSVGGFFGDLRYCLIESQKYNYGPAPSTVIVVQTNVTLTRPLPPWTPNAPQSLTPRADAPANQRTISGGNLARILFIAAPGSSVTVQDLALINGRARGGDGRHRGGGGAGLGGAIFVEAGSVSTVNVTFSGHAAVGGDSLYVDGTAGGGGGLQGHGGLSSPRAAGGGGGYFGNGGSGNQAFGGGGGGGLATDGADTGSFPGPSAGAVGGGGGGWTPAAVGGQRFPGAAGGTGGDSVNHTPDGVNYRDGLDAVAVGGGGGGGGSGYPYYSGGQGGRGQKYGGGGGAGDGWSAATGGAGGDYGGGGSSYSGRPGNGGFGGGGGAIGPDYNYVRTTDGLGGFGGGRGGAGRWPNGTGGGGSGFGGSIFLRSGANLTLRSGSVGPGTVAGGVSPGGMRQNGTLEPPGPTGDAKGDAAYVMSGATLTLDLLSPGYYTLSGLAGDGTLFMSGPAGATSEAWGNNASFQGLVIVQYGTLRLTGPSSFMPHAVFNLYDYGTLDLYGYPAAFTNGRLGGSTGTITNLRAGVTSQVSITTAAGATEWQGVSFQDAAGAIALTKLGAGELVLGGRSVLSLPTTLAAGTLTLAGGNSGNLGTLTGTIVAAAGTTLNTTVPNAFGYTPGRRVTAVQLGAGATLNHTAGADLGWGVAYTLDGASMNSNGGVNSATAASKFAFGGVSGDAPSLVATAGTSTVRGRVDLRGDYGRSSVDFTVQSGATLLVPACLTNTNGSVGLRKLGPGTMELGAANTYTGATAVAAGTLTLNASLPGGVGVVRGAVSVAAGASLRAVVTDALGYSEGTRVTALNLGPGALFEASASAGNQGWGVAYTLDTAVLHSNNGVASQTAESKFAFGGPAGTPTTVNVVGTGLSEIRGRADLRADNGNTVTTFTVATGAQLSVPAALTSSSGGGLRKDGPGTMIVRAANNYTGPTQVAAGTLRVAVGATLGTGPVTVSPGASLIYESAPGGNALSAGSGPWAEAPLTVGGTFTASGTLARGLTVQAGGVVAPAPGGRLTLAGEVVNEGVLRFAAGATLDAGGASSLVNHGVLDLLNAGAGTTLPKNFRSGPTGVVLTPESLRVQSLSKTAGEVTVQIDGWAGHSYRLQRAARLTGPFVDVGPAQSGQGLTAPVPLRFVDPETRPEECFYRVRVE